MRKIIKIFFLLLVACSVKAQAPPAPSGFPAPYSAAYYRIGWLQSDSGLILASRDTSVRSKFAGLMFLWQHAGLDSSQWFYNGSRYIKTLNSQDTLPGRFLVTSSALNNQGFLKNITGFVQQGTNVTITGSGTLLSPYVINSTASGGGDSAVNPGLFLGQSISGTTKTLYNDTSINGFSGYYLRRKDSSLYVTQTQLSTGLSSKQNSITTGTTLQYFRGDLSLATFPTNLSAFTNGPGYITGNQSISFTASGDVSGTFTNPTTLTPTLTIGNNKVTYAKFQASSQQALLGATGVGNFQEITLGTGLYMSGNTLNATGGAGISVDTIYRTLGKDSIQFTIGGRYHSILDSAGGSGTNTLTNTHIFVGNASNVATDVALSGDATMANTGALTLNTVNSNVGSFGSASSVATFTVNGKGLLTAAGSTSIQIAESQVTNLTTDLAGKQAALSGTGYLKFSGTTPSYLTPTQVTADLNLFSSSLQGLVPLSGGGTTNFLRADGTWSAPPGGGGLTYPNTTDKYLNGYGNFTALNTDSITIPGTPNGAQLYSDTLTGLINHIKGSGIVFNQGDSLVFFGDSYGNAAGATTTSQGIAQLLAQRLGAFLNNQSASGSTIEKRTPLNPFTGVNFIDRLPNIPHASSHVKYIIIWGGLNDYGVNSANYNTTNLKTDLDSVINYLIGTKGFTPEQILICSAPWNGSIGQASYAVLSGNAAPTTARLLSFIAVAKTEAAFYGTGYFSPYWYELHDTTQMSADGIHPNDAGYAFLANYLNITNSQHYIFPSPFTQSASYIKANIQNLSLVLGDHTIGSITTPNFIDMGKQFASAVNAQANLKLFLYSDGITINNTGFAVVPGALEIHAFNSGAIDNFIGNVRQTDLVSNKLRMLFGGVATATSTATPTAIDLTGSYNSTQGSNALKLFGYNDGTQVAGIGESLNSQYYSIYAGGHHDYYIGGNLYATINPHQFILDSLGGSSVLFNVNSKGLQIAPTGITTAFAAATTAGASISLPAGTAPTSPNNGDVWTDASHIYSRLSGVTYQLDQQGGGLPAITNYSYRGKLGGSDTILQYSTANVLDIGLKNDSSTDNTAILRAWLANPANARFTSLYFPGGGVGTGYLFSDSVLFLNPMSIYGDGPGGLDTFYTIIQLGKGATNLYMTSTTKSLFVFSNTNANKSPGFSVRNLSIINRNYYATAGSAIRFISNTMHPFIEHCTFRGFYIQIDNQSSMYADLLFNTFMAPGYCSLQQDNKVEVDAGAIKIIGNDFFAGTNTVNPPMYAVVIHGGGDIHIESNSFNAQEPFTNNAQYRTFVYSDFSTGATSDIWIHGNIMENFNSRAIWLRNLSGGRVTNIQIYGNEIAPYSSDTASLQAAIEIDSMTNISVDLLTALNAPAVNRAFLKLQNDTSVRIGGSIIYHNYNNGLGYIVQDSTIACIDVRRLAASNDIQIVTSAPYIITHSTLGGIRDSTFTQIPIDSFQVHFNNFSSTVSFAKGAGVVGLNTIQLGAVSMTTPGLLSTTIDSINGEKRFAVDLQASGIHFGNGNTPFANGNISIYGINGIQSSATGTGNYGIGTGALHALSSGLSNLGIGPSALAAVSTQSHNIGIGSSAGVGIISPDNTAIGYQSMIASVSGTGLNTAVGSGSLSGMTSGNTNTGIGYQTQFKQTTGSNNTAVGAYSNYNNVTGGTNTAVGTSALFSNTASGCTGIGNQVNYFETAANLFGVGNSPTNHFLFGDMSSGQLCINCTTTGTNQVSLSGGAGFELRGVKGFLWNNMTTTTRNALTTANGLRVINADSLYAEDYFDGMAWQEVASRNWVRANFGSGGTPGGSNTQVQFNNSGAFGGSANLTFNGTTLTANAMAISTYAAAGTNDSVVMWNPSTKLLEMRSGVFNLNVGNGLSPGSTTDSIIFGGTLTRPTTLATAGFDFKLTGLPNKSIGSTDSLLIQDNTGKIYKSIIPSSVGLLFTAVGATQAVNTTTETSIAGVGPGSLTIPANALTVGKTYRFKISGIYSTTTVPGNCTFKIKLGSVVIGTGTINNLITSASSLSWSCSGNIVCWTTGGSGSAVTDAIMNYSMGNLLAADILELNNSGVVSTINTTISNAVDFTVQWATADLSNTWKATTFTLESLN